MASVLHELPFLIAACAVASVAAVTDARTGRIPNWLTLGTLACAPVLHVAVALGRGMNAHDALARGGASVLGVFAAFVPLLLFRRGALGGGDVKLFAALGALCGLEAGLDIVLHSFFAGAILAMAVMIYRGQLLSVLRNVGKTVTNVFRSSAKQKPVSASAFHTFRFGPAIFVAVGLELLLRWR